MEARRDTKIFFVPERVEEARKSASNGRRITNKEIASKLNVSENYLGIHRDRLWASSHAMSDESRNVLGS